MSLSLLRTSRNALVDVCSASVASVARTHALVADLFDFIAAAAATAVVIVGSGIATLHGTRWRSETLRVAVAKPHYTARYVILVHPHRRQHSTPQHSIETWYDIHGVSRF
jgi:hypothetical protein